jgi:hypothetical protein
MIVTVILAGAVIILIFIHRMWQQRKRAAWNDDPAQQELVRLFIAAGRENSSSAVTHFVFGQNWSGSEIRRRIMHALRIVQETCEATIIERVKEIAWSLSEASYSL